MSEIKEMNLSSVTAAVDDIELLNILGIQMIDPIALLDWEDMPELDEDIDDDKESVVTHDNGNKRKYNDEEENLFNQFDFIEVPLVEQEQKKRKLSSFVDEGFVLDSLNINLEDDIQLALDLISC